MKTFKGSGIARQSFKFKELKTVGFIKEAAVAAIKEYNKGVKNLVSWQHYKDNCYGLAA